MEYIRIYIYYLNKNEISKTSSKQDKRIQKKRRSKNNNSGTCLNDEWIKVH